MGEGFIPVRGHQCIAKAILTRFTIRLLDVQDLVASLGDPLDLGQDANSLRSNNDDSKPVRSFSGFPALMTEC